MGRKIPGKKHRGVRDVFQQLAQRDHDLAAKTNAPPKTPDDQEIPKSVERLMKLKQDTKEGKFNRKRRKKKSNLIDTYRFTDKEVILPGMKRPDKTLPRLTQGKNEPVEAFLKRLDKSCNTVLEEVNFEKKYQVELEKDTETGRITNLGKPGKNDLENFEKRMFKSNRKSKDAPQKLTKQQKRRQKQLEKKLAKKNLAESSDDFSNFRDEVKFGEVVHCPPKLKPPRKGNTENTSKPGRRDLLLKSLLTKNSSDNSHDLGRKHLVGKRKDLSVADRRMLEKERTIAIEAYRNLKSRNKLL